jgi:hypothetical protein
VYTGCWHLKKLLVRIDFNQSCELFLQRRTRKERSREFRKNRLTPEHLRERAEQKSENDSKILNQIKIGEN